MKHLALSEVAEIIMGQSPPSSSYNTAGDGLPFFQGKTDFGDLYPTARVYCTAPNKIAESGDILISVRAPVGPTNLNPHRSCIGRGLAAIRANKDQADTKYILYFLRFHEVALAQRGTGSTFDAISREDLDEIRFPLPPLPEQRRLATLLDKADRLRRLRRYALELSETYLQSVFLELFGDPLQNPKGWDVTELGDYLDIISGHGFKFSEYADSGVKLLQIANVGFQEILWGTIAYLPNDYTLLYPKLLLKPGDLLMALNRPILGNRVKFAVLSNADCPAILYQRVGKLTLDNKVLRDFFFGFMLSGYFYNELKSRLAGSDQPYINPTELVKMKFYVPPLAEQEHFVHVASRYRRLLAQQREALRQAEMLFGALLKRAFEGEL